MRISDWSSDVCSSDLLDQIGSAAGQLRLELVDLVITLAPFGLARETLDALDQHPAVPAPIEDGDFAVARPPLPEAPEEMARLFLVARGADRSAERRVGKECVSKCTSRWAPSTLNKQNRTKRHM